METWTPPSPPKGLSGRYYHVECVCIDPATGVSGTLTFKRFISLGASAFDQFVDEITISCQPANLVCLSITTTSS